MSGNTKLYLGSKVSVDSSGNLDLGQADIVSSGANIGNLKTVVEQINADIAKIIENTDPAKIDSLSELLTQAQEYKELSFLSDTKLPYSAAIYADAKPPFAKSLDASNYVITTPVGASFHLYDGWYFKNQSAGAKVNWYMPNVDGLKFKDIRKLYMYLCVLNKTSLPWLTVYTKVKGDASTGTSDDNQSTWYNSKFNYLPEDPSVVEDGKLYNMYVSLDDAAPTLPADNIHAMVKLVTEPTTTKQSSTFSDEDDILYIAISTNSSSAVGNVSMIVSKLMLQTKDGIRTNSLTNSVVEDAQVLTRLEQLYQYFFQTSITDVNFVPTAQSE